MEWAAAQGRDTLEAVPSLMLEFTLLMLLGSPDGLSLNVGIRDGEKVLLHSKWGDPSALQGRNPKLVFTEEETHSHPVL